MAKSKLDKLLESRNEEQPLSTKSEYSKLNREELMQEIYDNRQQAGLDGGTSMLRSNARAALLERIGIDWYSIDDIEPNPDNDYSIDEKSIEGLAKLILESKSTSPLFLIETEEGKLRIIDGERRYRAHKLLAEKVSPVWKMVPGQCFKRDELSDDDIKFMLNALNIGQRAMAKSERSKGIAAIADRLKEQREKEPELYQGQTTAEVLAEQMGMSPRTISMEINIGRNLVPEGMDLLDHSQLSKVAANCIAQLPRKEQLEFIKRVENGELNNDEVVEEVKRNKEGLSPRPPKSTDAYLKTARNALKRAESRKDTADRLLIAECRNLLDKLDPDKSV